MGAFGVRRAHAAILRRGLAIVLTLAGLATIGAAPSPAAQRPGNGSIVVDMLTGAVLEQENADKLLYPASLTKVMTLYLTFEALDEGRLKLRQELPVSRLASSRAPTKLGLVPGSTLAVQDAILALVTKSANDAATTLAEAMAGSEEAFAERMTRQAHRLGMSRTVFRNASGLPDARQVTTPRDMARLGMAIQRDFPHYYHYFSTPEFSYGGQTFKNHNHLLGSYDGVDGIKTGYTVASGFNLVTAAQRDEVRLVGVVLGGRTSRERDEQMRGLLDAAFARAERGTALRTADRVVPLPAQADQVPAGKRRLLASAKPEETAPPVAAQRLTKVIATSAPAPQAEGDATATGDDSWAVQVGAFRNYESARNRALAAAELMPKPANRISVSISAGQGANPIYRVRLIGLADEREARKACASLKRRNIGCLALPPDAT